METKKMKTKEKGKAIIGIAMAAIVLALLIAMVPVVNAETEIEGQKGLFMMLSYITLGLSLLLFFFAFAYLLKRRKAGLVMWKRRGKEEEIIERIREIKELKRRIEERGENLTSLSDVFFTQVSILSEINSMKTVVSFGLEVLVALSLAIISMLFVMISMI